MARDFWGFKDYKDLEKSTKDMPDTILKEQITLLGEKTNFICSFYNLWKTCFYKSEI